MGRIRLMAMRLPLLLCALLVGFGLASCTSSSTPAPTPSKPTPTVVAPVSPPQPALAQPAGGWEDWPIPAGDWRFERAGAGAAARYGTTAGTAMSLSCDRPGLAIVADVAGMGLARDLNVRTTGGSETLTGTPLADGSLRVGLNPAAGILDRIAFSRGRFALANSAGQGVALPAWPEIGRLIEFCRGG